MAFETSPPDTEEIADLIRDINWVYLDSGDDGGVFAYNIIKLEMLAPTSYSVSFRTFENWINRENLESESIMVSGYQFDFGISYDDEMKWQIDDASFVEPVELQEMELSTFENKNRLSMGLVERCYGDFCPEELSVVDIEALHESLRPVFAVWLAKKLGLD